MKISRGFSLFEVMLMTALITILAVIGGTSLVNCMTWYFDMARAETSVNELFDTGLIMTRTVQQDKSQLASFTFSDQTLKYDGQVVHSGIDVATQTLSNGAIVIRLSSLGAASQTLRFVVNPLR
ncbi:MAG: hypothetical protein WA705_24665 [Candidatus Ozemobacteraceae bacterium]